MRLWLPREEGRKCAREIVRRRLGHDGTHPVYGVHQPHELETFKAFAQGWHRDTELSRQLRLRGEPIAGLEPHGADGILHRARHLNRNPLSVYHRILPVDSAILQVFRRIAYLSSAVKMPFEVTAFGMADWAMGVELSKDIKWSRHTGTFGQNRE